MNRSQWIMYGCIAFASFGLALGFTLSGRELLAPVVTILGVMWLVAVRRDWHLVTTFAIMVFTAGTAYAVWKGVLPGVILLVLAADLSAWDLIAMLARFKQVKKEAVEQGIEGKHLTRLAAVNGIGLLMGSAGLLLKLNLSFGVEILLGVIAAISLSQLVLRLRRSSG
jgi:hypothetical protein